MEPLDVPEPPDGTRAVIVIDHQAFLVVRDDAIAEWRLTRLGDAGGGWWCSRDSGLPWSSWERLMRAADEVYVVPNQPTATRESW